MRKPLYLWLAMGLASCATAAATALPTYTIAPLGLTDAEHTAPDGTYYSSASDLTESGYVFGQSRRSDPDYAYAGQSAWLFDLATGATTRLGFFDAAHTEDAGYRLSSAGWLSESGHAFGGSTRFKPGDADGVSSGSSAWVYDAHTGITTRLGYFDAAHVRSDGFQLSNVTTANDSGVALGTSQRFAGANARGQSAWLYDPGSGTTARLGYFDATHTLGDGSQLSVPIALTESGFAIGTSRRFTTAETGESAWLYDANSGTTTRVGFFDAIHTRSDGRQSSAPIFLTESGDVVGESLRYGLFSGGQSAWYYDSAAGTTTRIGLVDLAHTDDDGRATSDVLFATESGRVAGTSTRYVFPFFRGVSAWVFDPSTGVTSRVGFYDATHTSSNFTRVSNVTGLTDSGYAIGHSARYDGGATALGQSAWLYDPGAATTTRIGLTDAEHTASSGSQSSSATLVTDSGYAAGSSQRYNGTTGVGNSVWLYDARAGTTTRLGYFDAAHTRSSDGRQLSSVDFLTESGYAGGHSAIAIGGFGSFSAWIYDANDQTQHRIVLSETSDGVSDMFLRYLGEDGLALGGYELFAEDDTSLGDRAFAWTPDDGAFDLGALVLGGLPAAGWDALASAIRANGLAQILGSGMLANGGTLAYLLVEAPEPGTGLLLAIGIVVLTAQRKRTLRMSA